MAEIFVSGKKVLIDDQYVKSIKRYKWFISKGYAITKIPPPVGTYVPDGETIASMSRTISMHRFILALAGIEVPKNSQADHINWNKLDNRIENSRVVSRSENLLNKPLPETYANKTSLYKGVSKRGNKWQVVIRFGKKLKFLGTFGNEHEAGMFAINYFDKINKEKEIKRNELINYAHNFC